MSRPLARPLLTTLAPPPQKKKSKQHFIRRSCLWPLWHELPAGPPLHSRLHEQVLPRDPLRRGLLHLGQDPLWPSDARVRREVQRLAGLFLQPVERVLLRDGELGRRQGGAQGYSRGGQWGEIKARLVLFSFGETGSNNQEEKREKYQKKEGERGRAFVRF